MKANKISFSFYMICEAIFNLRFNNMCKIFPRWVKKWRLVMSSPYAHQAVANFEIMPIHCACINPTYGKTILEMMLLWLGMFTVVKGTKMTTRYSQHFVCHSSQSLIQPEVWACLDLDLTSQPSSTAQVDTAWARCWRHVQRFWATDTSA